MSELIIYNNLKNFNMLKSFRRSLVLWMCIGSVSTCWGHTLFDINAVDDTAAITLESGNSATARIERTADDKIEFIFEGTAAANVLWHVPIHSRIAANFEVEFELEADNIKQRKLNPNIYFRLEKRRGPAALELKAHEEAVSPSRNQAQMVPVYTSAGQRDSALGRISLDARDFAQTIEGLYIDLTLNTAGEGRLRVSTLRVLYEGNRIDDDEVDRRLSIPPPVLAEILAGDGLKPALSVNGHLESGLQYAPPSKSQSISSTIPQETGIKTRRIVVNFGGVNVSFPDHRPLWIHEDFVNYGALNHLLAGDLSAPDSLAIVDVLLHAPPDWWSEAAVENNNTAGATGDIDTWSGYCESAIKQLLAFVRTQSYAKQIIGCNIINGHGMNDYPSAGHEQRLEYVAAFRRWLSERYETVTSLRDSWQDSDVDFGNAVPLPASEWMRGSINSFVHPKSSAAAFDSYRYYFINWADSLIHLSRLVKTFSHDRYITGVVGGPGLYLNDLWNDGYRQNGEAIDRILESKYVDTIEVPVDLSDVRTGDGTAGAEYILSDKIRAAGKLQVARNPFPFRPPKSREETSYFTRTQTIEIQRRFFVANLINNSYMTVAGIGASDFREDDIISELELYNGIRRKSYKLTCSKKSEVAFVIAPDTFQYLAPGNESRTAIAPTNTENPRGNSRDIHFADSSASPYFSLYGSPRATWNRMGTSFDIVSIEALKPEIYKVLILFHVLRIDERRQKIIDRAKTGGRTLVSIWANGFVSDRYLSPAGMNKITGMRMKMAPGETRFHLTPRTEMRNFLNRETMPSSMGWLHIQRNPVGHRELRFGPIFTVNDETATILASYTDGGGAAMAVKSFPEWTSFYSASPNLNPEILRTLAKQKDVHIYIDTNDLSYINDQFIGIHSLQGGVTEIKLPTESALYEVFQDHELEKKRDHQVELAPHTTYLFYRGDKNTWMSL